MTTIRKVLIANRGEIAARVMRTARARGVATVAVFSDADARAYHVRCADEAVHIGPPEAAQSYLKIERIIEAAKASGADAIHPGYGFLSERAAFSAACAEAGIIFIGPPPAAIAAMGDKAESKRRMIAAGVPCIPGYQDEDQAEARLTAEAQRIGFPVMLKASAGGGGRGQRIVTRASARAAPPPPPRRESESAFGDGRLIVEKAIVGGRHVEIQVLADTHGKVLYLGERDCSLQRRRQKVIEEAPSPVITPSTRKAMGEAAAEAARTVGYRNAGTVEFLFEPSSGEFYFLEMNTRLQVEHPVTEMVTGLDIVALQFDIAEGKPLPLAQDDVRLNGHAVEARLYAEDPARNFLPQTGRITRFIPPAGVRVDQGVETGDEVSAFYDPMIAKVIAHGATRDEACAKLASALDGMTLLGLTANAPFLSALLRDEIFLAGGADIGHIERHLGAINAAATTPVEPVDVALAAAALLDRPFGDLLTGWHSRGGASFPIKLQQGEETITAVIDVGRNWISAKTRAGEACIEILAASADEIVYRQGSTRLSAAIARDATIVDVKRGAHARRFIDMTFAPAAEQGAGADAVMAPMAGAVTSIAVKPGDSVAKGQTVATIEAMKMEHQLKAPRDGVVAEVLAKAGDQVAIRAKIVALKPEA
ncbi:MAG: acetyl/propionyl/methylcrotonyl-CoA carboxylase subunit alpha [Parvularculaceae bacterium]